VNHWSKSAGVVKKTCLPFNERKLSPQKEDDFFPETEKGKERFCFELFSF
jgi:hypothetical protein